MLICSMYITWPKQFKPGKVLTVVHCILVVSALTYYTSFCVWFKSSTVENSLIQELMLYVYKLGHNAAESTKTFIVWQGKA